MAKIVKLVSNLSMPLGVCTSCFRMFLRAPVRTEHRALSCLSSPKLSSVGSDWSLNDNRMKRHPLLQRTPPRLFVPQTLACAKLFSTDSAPQNPPKKKSREQSKKSPISWKTLAVVAGIGGAIILGMQMVKKEKEQERKKKRSRLMGKALLGGDWTLTDHHGNRRSSTEFRGQWVLIYFGFTNCPDICPEEIEKIVRVINQTDADAALPKIQPIVITVDPERDTAEALKEYCGEFSPRLLGFTGTIEEITAATRAYRVYFSAGPKDEDNDYIVDHSIISYLVNPEGDFVDYFGQNKTSDEIYSTIKLHISAYNIAEKKRK